MKNVYSKGYSYSEVNTIDETVSIVSAGTRVALHSFTCSANSNGTAASWGATVDYTAFPNFEIYQSASGTDILLHYIPSNANFWGLYGQTAVPDALINIPGRGILLDGLKFHVEVPTVSTGVLFAVTVNVTYTA